MEGIMESMYGGDFSSYFSMNSQFFTGFNVWQELVPGGNGELINDTVISQYDVLYDLMWHILVHNTKFAYLIFV